MLRIPAKSKRAQRQPIHSTRTLPAPVKGWNTRDAEALMPPGYAGMLNNLFPSADAVGLRKGASDHLTGMDGPVKTLMVYSPVDGGDELFACTDTGVYNATAAGAVGAVADAHTNGECYWINFRTSGGSFLVVINGTNSLRTYNGAAWTDVASFAISGGGTLTTTSLSTLHAHKRRIFLFPKDSLDFYTLPIDSISGDVTLFPLGGLFVKGGNLVAMGTWTVDSGQGADDFAVFVTSKGQVAIYQGTDPTDATAWSLVGVYDLAEPLGKRCFHKYGGDLLYLSKNGLYPLSKALQSTELESAISEAISPTFNRSAAVYGANYGWCLEIDEPNNLLLVNVPTTNFALSTQYAMNTKTGAWCSFTDWDAFCFTFFNGALYMGMDEKVAKAYSGPSDFDGTIVGTVRQAYDYLGTRTQNKHVKLARPIITLSGVLSVEAALDMDFQKGTTFGPTSFFSSEGALWDTGVWDEALWSDEGQVRANWLTVAAHPGYCAALRLRFTSSTAIVSWSATDLAFERGGLL
jgi:hypothetical protein